MLTYFIFTLGAILIAAPAVYFFGVGKVSDKHGFTIAVGVAALVSALISATIFGLSHYSKTMDVEVWNGEVTGKERKKVSCEHDYKCNCTTHKSCSGTGKNRSCTDVETCQTCYDHPYDVDWNVYTNLSNFRVKRINRQGTDEPPRWTVVQIGQPYAETHIFNNYIKGVNSSIFNFGRDKVEAMDSMVPAYPANVYDYQFVDRVFNVGRAKVPDIGKWNYSLALKLKQLGPQRQANAIILFAGTDDPRLEYNVRDKWLGGKKNDIIVLIGVPEYPKISWVRVLSWTDSETFKVQLRDEIQAQETLDMQKVLDAIGTNTMATFKRKRMRDFDYLKNEIEIPSWAYLTSIALSLAGLLGVLAFNMKQRPKFNSYGRRLY